MKLFLDDIRDPKDCTLYMTQRVGSKASVYTSKDWLIVRDYNQFKDAVISYASEIELISFDHDLADEHYAKSTLSEQGLKKYYEYEHREMTGYDCLIWLIEHYNKHHLKLPEMIVHSMNPNGRLKIENLISKSKQ